MKRWPTNRQPGLEGRSGAVIVETAVVLPVFIMLLFAMLEFGHAYLVIGTLNAAVRRGARAGAADGATTQTITNTITGILTASKVVNAPSLIVQVKDGSIFDTGSVDPKTIDYSSLPDVEVHDLTTRDMFIVRVQVPYSEVSVVPPLWANSVKMTSVAVMRHE